ncbi:MAG: glutathione S-transferase family protein, partial [Xanthobacteraceae bacterium]|nr:glutathione S-transferase family protein [Xanthobacteraceae bacterium]
CLEFPIERPDFPELMRWMAAIEARPAFAVATGAKPSTLASAA